MVAARSRSKDRGENLNSVTRKFGWLLFVAGSLIAIAAALLYFGQCAVWLQTGAWPAIGMRIIWAGSPDPLTDLIGLQKIIDWFSGFPAALGIGFIGLCVVNVGLKMTGD
jgi:hypothetical protein